MTKNLYSIHNDQGAWLIDVISKDEKNAIMQAKKIYTGKLKAIKRN